MIGLSHAGLILASSLSLALSIPAAALRPRVFISPLPFRFTSALTFSLASGKALILYIPLASTFTLDMMEDLVICVIYFAFARTSVKLGARAKDDMREKLEEAWDEAEIRVNAERTRVFTKTKARTEALDTAKARADAKAK